MIRAKAYHNYKLFDLVPCIAIGWGGGLSLMVGWLYWGFTVWHFKEMNYGKDN